MESSNSPEQLAQNILMILYPLLTSPQDATTRSIIATLRTFSSPVSVLANTLYIFSKLLPTDASANMRLTPQQTAFRNMIANLLHSNIISHGPLFECFDADTLTLYVDASSNHKNEEKRLRTRLWFTQTRFNLFREESEGYAKVVTLLWEGITSNPPRAESLIDNLIALIGQFSLDSNRVIELVLSAASDVVSDLIAQSHVIPNDTRLPRLFCLLLDEFAPDHVYNVVGAMFQSYHPMLHFKNDLFASPDLPSTDNDKKASRQFLGLVAVLIREGRMAVADVWHHLSPRDNREVFNLFLHFEYELVELSKNVCSSSCIALHDQLIDPAKLPRPGQGASDRDLLTQYRFISQGPFSNVQYQKLQLISQLIGMCRWRDAMSAILHLSVNNEHVDVAADPYIAVPISKFVEFLLSPVMNAMFPAFYPQHAPITDAIDRLGGQANGYPSPVRTIDQFLSRDPDAPGMYVREMLFVLGPYARVSTRLLYALCRLLKGRKEDEVFNIMRDVVLPAASLTQSNAGLANTIWNVLKDWPHIKRWEMYGHLQKRVCNTCAVYQVVAERASYEMRFILKRLTSETQRVHGNTVAKITHGQALAAFSATLDRVQGYPADPVTIIPVIEACKDCTSLALDMLIFLVLDRMADSSRSRLKEDGINVAQWYSTLSLFLGLCLRKLSLSSQHMEGVVGFLHSKLAMEPEPLLITALSDIIKCVADIEVDVNLTAKQISAQGGGRYLQKIVGGVWGRLQPEASAVGSSFDLRVEREMKFAVFSLQEAFAKNCVHVWIGISIAQLTRTVVFEEDLKAMPLKLSANIVDRARSSLIQLSQFLDLVPNVSSLSEKVRRDLWDALKSRGLTELITAMNVPTSSAAILLSPTLDFLSAFESDGWRPVIAKDEVKKTDEIPSIDGIVSFECNSREGTDERAKRSVAFDASTLDSTEKTRVNVCNKTGSQMDIATLEDSSVSMKSVHFSTVISNRTNGTLSPMLVNAFWTLKFSDICVPESLYNSELKRMHSIKSLWEREYERFRRHTYGETDRSRCVESELKLIRENTDKLEKEKGMIVERHKLVIGKLRRLEKELCTPSAGGTKEERVQNAFCFLQECVLPKSRVSAPDALFCAKFILLLLELDIPAIANTEFFEILLSLVPVILRSCSENEALCFSRLIKEVLISLEKWRSNKKIFEKEVQSAVRGGLQTVSNGQSRPFRHEQYCQWLFDIHNGLTLGVCAVVTHREYLYSRNCLSILAGVAEVFPKVSEHSAKIEECIAELTKSDLEDIRISSNGVLARLRSGKAKRVPEFMFRLRPHCSHSAVNGNLRIAEFSGAHNSPTKSINEKIVPDETKPPHDSNFVKSESALAQVIMKPIEASLSPATNTSRQSAAAEAANTRLSSLTNPPVLVESDRPRREAQLKSVNSVQSGGHGAMNPYIQVLNPLLKKGLHVDVNNAHSLPSSEDESNARRTKLATTKRDIVTEPTAPDVPTASRQPDARTLPFQADLDVCTTKNVKDTPKGNAMSPSFRFKYKSPEISVKNNTLVNGKGAKVQKTMIEGQASEDKDGAIARAPDNRKANHSEAIKTGSGILDNVKSRVVEADSSERKVGTSLGRRGDVRKAIISTATTVSNALNEKKNSSSAKDSSRGGGRGDVNGNGPENGSRSPQQGARKIKNDFSELGDDLLHRPVETVADITGTRKRANSGESSGHRVREKTTTGAGRWLQNSRIANNLKNLPGGRDGSNCQQNGGERGLVGTKRTFDDTQSGRISGGNGLGTFSGNRELDCTLGSRDVTGRGEIGGSRNRRGGENFDVQGIEIISGTGCTIDDGSLGKDGYADNINNTNKRRREVDVRRRGRLDSSTDHDRRRDGADTSGSHLSNRYAGGNGISLRTSGGSAIEEGGNIVGGGYARIGGYGGGQGLVGWSAHRDDGNRRRPETDHVGWMSRSREAYEIGRSGNIAGSGIAVDRYRDRRDERWDHLETGLEREVRGDQGRDRDYRDSDRADRRRHLGGGNKRRRNIR